MKTVVLVLSLFLVQSVSASINMVGTWVSECAKGPMGLSMKSIASFDENMVANNTIKIYLSKRCRGIVLKKMKLPFMLYTATPMEGSENLNITLTNPNPETAKEGDTLWATGYGEYISDTSFKAVYTSALDIVDGQPTIITGAELEKGYPSLIYTKLK